MANLLRYSERAKFATQIGLVGVAHFASAYNVIGDDGSFAPLAELVGDELVDDLLADSYIDACVRADAKGRSVLGSYLRERAARETPVGRDFLRGLAESEVGAFEVLAAEQQAVRLRDALEEREPFVAEIDPDCEVMDAGAVIGARVSRFRGSLPAWSAASGR